MAVIVPAAFTAPPPLHTEGRFLKDNAGNTVILKGLNIPSLEVLNEGEGGRTRIMAQVNHAINVWKVNLIRLPISQDRWEGFAPVDFEGKSNNPTVYRSIVDEVVATASAAGVYVLVDMHWSNAGVWGQKLGQHEMPDDNTSVAWAHIAAHYANNPAVLFDAYNEPHPDNWTLWRNGGQIVEDDGTTYHSPGMQSIVDTIRANAPNNIILVAGIGFASNLSGITNGFPINGTNIMYSTHLYPVGDIPWEQNNLGVITQNKGPILVGEFGADPTDDYAAFYARILPFITSNGLSSTAWSLNTTYTPALISDYTSFTRTFHHGNYVFNWMNGGVSAPASLLASGGNGSVSLTWTSVTGATSYNIHRSTTPHGEGKTAPIATGVTGTSYTDTGLTNGTAYFYQVVAINSAKPSMPSGPSPESGAYAGTAGRYRIIYDDQLRSGFYNYSFAALPEPSNISPVYTGQFSFKAISNAGQGIQFRGSQFNSAPYNMLSFWMNGGDGGGQTIQLIADLGAANGTPVTIGPLPANTWKQYNISLASLGAANSTILDGFRFQTPNGNTNPTYYIDDVYLSGGTVVPAAPTGLTAEAGNGLVALRWPLNGAHDVSYNLYRGTTPGGQSAIPIASNLGVTGYTDSGLTNGVTYYYKLAVANSGGTSALSASEASATPQSSLPPPAPLGLTAVAEEGKVRLSWQPSAGATSYTLYRGTVPGGETPLISNVTGTTFTNVSLVNGTKYYYTVAAANGSNVGGKSDEATATPFAPQFGFENGVQGWVSRNPSVTVATSTVQKFSGAQSLAVNFNNSNGQTDIAVSPSGAPANTSITYHVWIPAGSKIEWIQPFIGDTNFRFKGTFTPIPANAPSGWRTLVVDLPADFTAAETVGVQFKTSSAWTGTCYIDTVSWPQTNTVPATPAGVTASAGSGQAVVTWFPAKGAVSYNIFRSTAPGGEGSTPIATGIAATSFTNSGLVNGTTYYYKVTGVNPTGSSAQSAEASARIQGSSLPSPKVSADVGAPSLAGTANFANGVYTVRGAGTGFGSTTDQFHFVNQSFTSNRTLIARVTGVANTEAGAAAGLMLRGSTAANAAFATVYVKPSGSIQFRYRLNDGSAGTNGAAVSRSIPPSTTNPVWLKLEKNGSFYNAYYYLPVSSPATPPTAAQWVFLGNASPVLPSTYFGGLIATSRVAGTLGTATFDNVTP